MKTFCEAVLAMIGPESRHRDHFRELSWRQTTVLLMLYRNKATVMSVRDLRETIEIAKPAITRALDRLQLAGLVTRHDHDIDRRLIGIRLTEAGTEAAENLEGMWPGCGGRGARTFCDAMLSLMDVLPGRDMTWRQTAVLMLIYMNPLPLGVRELVSLAMIPKPAITINLNRLVDLGFAYRAPHPVDARMLEARLTPQGQAVAMRMAALWPSGRRVAQRVPLSPMYAL